MKHFIKQIVLMSLPVLFILVGINYTVDPARIFDTEYIEEMASILKSGNHVTNISNYDERLFQREIIKQKQEAPEVLVLGSSRTMLINTAHFEEQTLFNHSVSGASLEDMIAIYQLYKAKNSLPQKIMIGVDPWIFNKNNGQSRWKSIASNYYQYHGTTQFIPYTVSKCSELLSLSYFQASLKALPAFFTTESRPESSTNKENKSNTKLTDGSIGYAEGYRNASQKEINSKIQAYTATTIFGLAGFKEVSTEKLEEFTTFISRLKKQNIQVEFFLSPYPPLVFDKISKDYSNVLKVEELVTAFAKQEKINVIGSFSPYELDFDETQFYDGMHCNKEAMNKLLKN